MSTQSYLQPVGEQQALSKAGTETADNGQTGPTPPSGGDVGGSARTARPRAEKALPTDRLKFDNQLKVLRNVAITSGNNRRGSTAEAMSAAIDLSGGTGGLNSRFFRSAGWFESVGRGEYTASPGTLAWNQHTSIDPDARYEATALMRTEVKGSWFWETLEPLLVTGQPVAIKLALLELAKAAGATNHAAQLETIVQWLVWVGLIVREGDQIRLRPTEPAFEKAASGADATHAGDPIDSGDDVMSAALAGSFSTSEQTSTSSDSDAIVSFNMSVRLTAADMQSLDQEQRDFVLALAERLRG
jgi:hypothetical protein